MFQDLFSENVNNNLIAAQNDNTKATRDLNNTMQKLTKYFDETVSSGVQFNNKGQMNSVFAGSSMINSLLNVAR
jgi:hypothetical protein